MPPHLPFASDRPIFFVSDVHLQPSDASDSPLVRDLHAFFAHVEAAGAELFILGDLFDFWFEYRHAVLRSYLPTLQALQHLATAGVPVTFIPGNHDFWAGEALEMFGVRIARGPLRLSLHGRSVLLAHGDGIAVREPWTHAFRTLVHSRLAIAAFRLLSPDIGVPLAVGISRISRHFSGTRPVDAGAVQRQLTAALGLGGVDLSVVGHYHQPTHVQSDGRDFAIIADFYQRRTYARLDNGVFSLQRWDRSDAIRAG